LFREQGVPDDAVNWVFSPNGWSDDNLGHPRFEAYYPGNSLVDVVAFSAFNYGTCVWDYAEWGDFNTAFKPYLDRMRVMAPSKPIFVAQTGSSDLGGNKDQWLRETLVELARYPALQGIIYFHLEKVEGLPCDPLDWRFYAPQEGIEFPGILKALSDVEAGFAKLDNSSALWSELIFQHQRRQATFEDVEASQPLAQIDDVWYYEWVEALAAAGLTTGCGADPVSGLPQYCPFNAVTRAEMAVFLLKGEHGAGWRPAAVDPLSPSPYTDIAGHWAEPWVRALYATGIASVATDGRFRPDDPITRAETAVFLLKARHGSDYQPAPAGGRKFTDLTGHWAESWVAQLEAEGIATGFPDGSFKPDGGLNRAEMAVFLVKGFELPLR
jgi:hypothetical protein